MGCFLFFPKSKMSWHVKSLVLKLHPLPSQNIQASKVNKIQTLLESFFPLRKQKKSLWRKKKDAFNCQKSGVFTSNMDSLQGWANYDPGATCYPLNILIRPCQTRINCNCCLIFCVFQGVVHPIDGALQKHHTNFRCRKGFCIFAIIPTALERSISLNFPWFWNRHFKRFCFSMFPPNSMLFLPHKLDSQIPPCSWSSPFCQILEPFVTDKSRS